jgi:hypothetical protein
LLYEHPENAVKTCLTVGDKGLTCGPDDFLGLYRKGSMIPLSSEFVADDFAVNMEHGFSIGRRCKANL